MNTASTGVPQRDESPSAAFSLFGDNPSMFQLLFERSADAILLVDPQTGVFVDCNQATVELMRADSKERFLNMRPEDFSPPLQPDGTPSRERTAEVMALVEKHGGHRFEWLGRRFDGTEVPMEVLVTSIQVDGRKLNVSVARDITERKKTERELLELNLSLEQRVAERTVELSTSEARFRAMVEHAPEAIVVYNADTGRFMFGNQHACDIYGVLMSKLPELTPMDVSPEFQPCGQRTSDLAREKTLEVLSGGIAVFEWTHRQPNGRLIPTEVRLLRLPAEGQNLIRASIIDNTERKRAEQALRESEEKFRALFEGSSQGVILQDENEFLEVNPAAVRIMGCQSPQELLGRNPTDTSPPFQPNGESTAVLARKYVRECMVNGSVRFEWTSCTPQGREIPLDVTLTRIQWSGRQVIQALLNDISERKKSEQALREANRELHREVEQRTHAEELLNERIRMSTLIAEVAVALNANSGLRAMLQECAELVVRHLDVAFARVWTLNETTRTLELEASAGCYTHLDGPHSRIKAGQYKIGLIAQEKKPHLTNEVQTDTRVSDKEWAAREGMVAFAGYPLLLEGRVLGVLAMFARRPLANDILTGLGSVADSLALGIERKRAQAALAESEARFSAAFQASPILIAIGRLSDERFVLVNDAFANWTGYSHEEILGRNSTEFRIWESREEREAIWTDLRRNGSIRERECRLRNRSGKRYTMLMSFEVIQLNHVPHVLGMALDITERKEAEAEARTGEARLRESEARFSAAFQASPAFLGVLRMSDEKYVLVNDAYLNWLGYPREEVLGRTCVELGLWENIDERDVVLKDMHDLGSIRQRECRWKNRRGERFTILLSAETIKLNNEPHMLSMAMDITQRKRAEEELLNTLEREKELSQLKSNFVSMVSHEFRTPLGIIQSSGELLRDFYRRMSGEERDEQLESIIRNTRRMAGMMEEILVLSRLDAGKLEFRPHQLDFETFCRRVVDEVLSATQRRCPIEISVSSALPNANADERLLGHIFTNLLSNAIKYSESGAPVRFSVAREGADAVCSILDHGIGISDDDQARIFTAFHRGDNVGNRSGTGLGLVLVKRCVELHHGKMQLQSALTKGTTVTVRLPVF